MHFTSRTFKLGREPPKQKRSIILYRRCRIRKYEDFTTHIVSPSRTKGILLQCIKMYFPFITARKQSLRRLCFYRCLSVHKGGMRGCSGGMRGCSGGACVVALGGHAWLLLGGCAWLLRGACVVAPGGACMAALGGHAWLLPGRGACMVALGGMCGCSGGACMVAWGGMHGCSRGTGGHAWLLGGMRGSSGGIRGCSGGVRGCSWGGVHGCSC